MVSAVGGAVAVRVFVPWPAAAIQTIAVRTLVIAPSRPRITRKALAADLIKATIYSTTTTS